VKKRHLLFIYTSRSTFVKRDIDILNNNYIVDEFQFHPKKKLYTPFIFLSQLFFLLKNFNSCNLILIQFGGYHSFLPVLLSKTLGYKCAIIAGGVDCVYYPQIGYGYMGKSLISWFTRFSFRHCNLILPKHESLIEFEDHFNEPNLKQGLNHHIRNLETPYKVIPNGFDNYIYKKNSSEKIKNSYITAAIGLDNNTNIKLKGIDLIISVATHFPNSSFTIIGGELIQDKKNIPSNVLLLPPLNQIDLIEHLSRSEFYLQLSMSEGFPNGICEAMLCECIPIGSSVNSIPEIIGENGEILTKRDTEEFIAVLKRTENRYSNEKGQACRKRIIDFYSLENRASKLLDAVDSLIQEK
jgi:glycosyltransferase involved in cell wall biosynthesis